jgi:hypothetical protein
MGQIKDLWDTFGGLNKAKTALSWLARLALNPLILIPLLVAGGIWFAIKSFQKNDEEQKAAAAAGDVETLRKKLSAGMGAEAEMYANQDEMVKNALRKAGTPEALAALKKMEEGNRPQTNQDKYDQFLADRGYYKSMGYKNLKGQMVPEDLKKAALEYASGQTENQSAAETARLKRQNDGPPAYKYLESEAAPSTVSTPVAPMPPEPKSAPVSSLTNTNIEMNLPNKPDTQVASVNKTVNNLQSQNKEKSGLKPSQISVRNDEESYEQMIELSLRMI